MTTRVDLEDITATKSERFLAVVLAAFLLVGSIWFYVQVDDWSGGGHPYDYTLAEQKIVRAQDVAWQKQAAAEARADQQKTEVQLAKDALDIALAKGEATDALESKYDREVADFAAVRRDAAVARGRAEALQKKVGAIDARYAAKAEDVGRQWAVAGIRLAFVLGWFAASLRLVSSLRKRQSRFLPLGFATVAAGVVTALVFATDYILDYIDPLDLGPIVLSVAGAAATFGAFLGLQRWLARRIPGRRVRNSECPFCGHPVRGSAESLGGRFCEGCGREVIATCASCGAPRRVGSPHCANCGKA